MKISLIINTYNRPDFLEKSLLSLSVQNAALHELIISDDGSKEDLLAVISKYAHLFNCSIKYITQSDSGFRLARCRNNAARIATGDFLFFLDQDLIYTKNFLNTMIKNIKKNYFLVAWPIRTSELQKNEITFDHIKSESFLKILTNKQIKRVKKQFFKDLYSRIMYALKLQKYGTKFRGGLAGIFKDDYIKINGYDEKYIGWGNEDDDFGRRLYLSGIKGINPFYKNFPIHLWHPENHAQGERVNKNYHKSKSKLISKTNYSCEFGYNNSLGDDIPSVTVLK